MGEVKVEIERSMGEPLSPSAVVFVRTFSAHIIVTVGLDSPINLDAFKAQLPLALNHPRFSSIMVGDAKKDEKLKWVQIPHVNVDDHIIVPSINPTLINNRLIGDKFVEDYLHNLTKSSIDMSKPPWELHALNVKTSEAESVCIFRIHHALGDGISITSHMLAWTRQLLNPDSLPTIATMKKKEKKQNMEMNGYGCWKSPPSSIILVAWWWLQMLWNTIVDVSMFLATIFFLKDSDMLIMENLKTDTNRARIVYKVVSLDDMKLIKNAMNVTINDVAVGLIEGGLSRYLNRRFGNDGNKGDLKTNKILRKMRIRSGLAVNLRPLEGIQDLDDIKNKDTKLGLRNEFGFVVIPMSILMRDDPLEYVLKAKATMDRKKQSFEAKANINLCKVAAKIFGFKVAGLWTAKLCSHLSIAVSNVPGPAEEITFFGHRVKFIAPTVHGMPSPIMIHFQSCANRMTIVLSLREDVMIDPHELLDDIVESLLLMRAAVLK